MPKTIRAEIESLALGQTAVIHGARVTRRSLLGFELDGARALLEAAEISARIEAKAHERGKEVRVALCARCAGDGLGRRNRGACGLCHGPGIQVVTPFTGWDEASPAELLKAVDQALSALRKAPYPKAQASLLLLLARALPLAPSALWGRALGELRQQGFTAEAAAIERSAAPPKAA